MDNITTILTSITAFILALAGIINAVMKSYNDIKKETTNSITKKIKNQSEMDIEILNKMEEAKEKLNADRIQVYDFHNGIHYANGRNAIKFSCTYEVVRAGVKPLQIQLQNIPFSAMPRFIKELLSNEKMSSLNIEKLKETMPSLYDIKKYQEIKSFYDVTINNKYNEPIGMLSIQYKDIRNKPFTEENENEILRLKLFVEEELFKMVD